MEDYLLMKVDGECNDLNVMMFFRWIGDEQRCHG